jgi:pilus assembly protein CpaC
MLLRTMFPTATLHVRATQSSVILSGFVDRPDHVSRIVEMARDYYPKVINLISVGGVQQILLHVKVMEVSRTKLRRLSSDWNLSTSGGYVIGSVSGLIAAAAASSGTVSTAGAVAAASTAGSSSNPFNLNDTIRFGIIGSDAAFFGLIDAMRRNDLAKILAEPTLVTVSGRPAFFNDGGEFPVPVPQSLGTISIQWKKYGTQVDFVPIVLGNGRIRLEVRPRVSELDPARSIALAGTTIPALKVREVDTGVEMQAGQTLALAGLVQTRIQAENAALPYLGELPVIGTPFRKVREIAEDIELLILVTPEVVDALDPEEVPPCGPGERTTRPSNGELYWHGYIEVPACCTDGSCESCNRGEGANGAEANGTLPPGAVEIPPGQPSPADGAARGWSRPSPAARTWPGARTVSGPGAPRGGVRTAPDFSGAGSAQLTDRSVSVGTAPSYDRTDARAQNASGPTSGESGPGLIGPLGYDVNN